LAKQIRRQYAAKPAGTRHSRVGILSRFTTIAIAIIHIIQKKPFHFVFPGYNVACL